MKHLLIIICLSLFAVFIHGYKFAFSDQEIFIPYLLKEANPSLFPNDALFNQLSAKTSLFYPLYGQLLKFIDIQDLFFASYLLFQIFFFLAIYRLSFVLLKNKNLAYLSLVLFLLPKFIGGTATSTFDDFFGYRSTGVIFLIFYLSYLIEGRMTKAAFLVIGGFIFHALSIIPNFFLFPALLMRKKLKDKKETILLLTVAVAFISFAAVLIFPKDDLWQSIIQNRDSYVLPSTWKARGWLSFALYFSLLSILLPKLDKKIRTTVLFIVFVGLITFLANYIVLDLLKTPQIAKLQLARAITPTAYIALAASPLLIIAKSLTLRVIGAVSLIALALNKFELFSVLFIIYVLVNLLKKHRDKIESKGAFALIFVILLISPFSIIVQSGGIRSQWEKIQYPKVMSDWIDVQLWARKNTPANSTFLVSPRQTGFRIFSQRPIVGDIKDGAVVIYDRAYAKHWYELMNDLKEYESFDESDLLLLSTKYSFEYVIVKKHQNLKLDKVYENKAFTVFKI